MNNIEKKFKYLLNEYQFSYSKQVFSKDVTGFFYGPMIAYSFYNENGCFTIHHAVQRNEWDYYVGKYSTNKSILLARCINEDIFKIEKQSRWSSLANIFKSEFTLISQYLHKQILDKGEFFGIKVKDVYLRDITNRLQT